MAANDEKAASSSGDSASIAEIQYPELTVDTTLSQPVPTVPPPVVPSIAPVPLFPPSVPRPLAPLPVRPPALKPPVPQNGELGASDSESDDEDDDDDSGHHTTTGAPVAYENSEQTKQARERQEKLMQELLMKRRAAALAVPTNDKAVRARLRRLGEPITLFGEREMERRDDQIGC